MQQNLNSKKTRATKSKPKSSAATTAKKRANAATAAASLDCGSGAGKPNVSDPAGVPCISAEEQSAGAKQASSESPCARAAQTRQNGDASVDGGAAVAQDVAATPADCIEVIGAKAHNLKNINLKIPRGKIVAFTGKSGSGKSTLAFDTIYAEGYRKYMESLSADARRLLSQIDKPEVESIRGLSPVIAIEQVKSLGSNPRSTLATLTEIADYARLIWAMAGEQRCPKDGGRILRRSLDDCVAEVEKLPPEARVYVLAPKGVFRPTQIREEIKKLRQQAWQRACVNGRIFELDDPSSENEALAGLDAKQISLSIVIDRFPRSSAATDRIADSLELAFREGAEKAVIMYSVDGETKTLPLSSAFACETCATTYAPLTVQSFSFNHPSGACPLCGGIGKVMRTNAELAIPDASKSIKDGAIKAWRIGSKTIIIIHNRILRQLAEQYPFSLTTPWKDLPEDVKHFLLYGDDERVFSLRIRRGNTRPMQMTFGGILADVDRICAETSSDAVRARLSAFQTTSVCPECGGARLSKRSRNVFVEGVSYDKFCAMCVGDSLKFITNLVDNKKYAPVQDAVKGLYERLKFLEEVGLSYIGLDREASTLSGGEAQRARLATQLGMDLTGVTYVLDEPTIGLHKSDNFRLINAIKKLKARGNTVLLVEHDEDALAAADWIVELGPEAGEKGGNLIFNGSVEDCLKSDVSRTGMYLSGRAKIERPAPKITLADRYLTVKNASENNLKNITVKFPVGLLTVVCGVSGSGKSTLVNEILAKAAAAKLNGAKEISGKHGGITGLEYFTTCVRVDQSPIGKSPRSNPATYTKLFDLLRELYAQCPLSKARGYQAGRFSFNVKGGRCENCQGDGCIHLDMQFLGDVYVTCPSCGGKRYNRETLEVRYKGLNIAEALNLTVSEACEVFSAHPKIMSKLQTLKDVGLDYIRLGQAANTLSGGEAQRIKLSLELSRRTHGQALYILDEPTTGLHWDDIDKLLKLLFKLRDAGNTIIVIEHHPDFIRLADYIIELGPTGGDKGGYLLTKQD